MTDGERAAEDRRIRAGEADVVLGARSAVFAPLANVGLDHRRRGARGVLQAGCDRRAMTPGRWRIAAAGWRMRSSCTAARPHVPSRFGHPAARHADRSGRRGRRCRTSRSSTCGPSRRDRSRVRSPGPCKRRHRAVRKPSCCSTGVVWRGWRLCRACGWIARCPSCDVPLVVHDRPEHLVCHHCGYDAPVPVCARRVAPPRSRARARGPRAWKRRLRPWCRMSRLIRLDGDAIARRGELEAGSPGSPGPGAAVLLGTQMVAKGHDLPAVTVAGVLDADGALQRPDFRVRGAGLCADRAAGRTGRTPRRALNGVRPGVGAGRPRGSTGRAARGRGVPGRRDPPPAGPAVPAVRTPGADRRGRRQRRAVHASPTPLGAWRMRCANRSPT